MTLLGEAAFLLAAMVGEEGDVRKVTLAEAATRFELPLRQARRLVERIVDAGFVELVDGQVTPTLTGVELGVLLARSRADVRHRELRLPKRRFWTYIPKEVNLSG